MKSGGIMLLLAIAMFGANISASLANTQQSSKGKGKKSSVPTLTQEQIEEQKREHLNALIVREVELKDSIALIKGDIAQKRETFTAKLESKEIEMSEDEQNDFAAEMRAMEETLFDMTSELSNVSNEVARSREKEEIKRIEILADGEYVEEGIFPTDSVTRITVSRSVSDNLTLKDYNTLYEADIAESHAFLLHAEYLIRHEKLKECAERYKQSSGEAATIKIEAEFRERAAKLDSISKDLAKEWGAIYDSKSFIYGLLLETLGFGELLERWDTLANEAADKATEAKTGGVASEAIIDYEYQKHAMSELEHSLATRLNMPNVIDSMDMIANKFRLTQKGEMPEVTIKNRNFITYEPLKFLAANAAHTKKAIPKAKMYGSGTIYRILVGLHKTPQNWSTFKGAYPVSQERLNGGFYAYYIGGFSTMMEALWAQATLKKRGFSRVDIVMWQDGAEGRNLTRNPIGKNGFRVRIDNMKVVTPEIKTLIEKCAGKAPLMKIGATSYAIANIKGYAEAEALKNGLQEMEGNIRVTLTEL